MRYRLAIALVVAAWSQPSQAANMNGRPGQYKISNGNSLSNASFSTDYDAEYFEVFSPVIRTRYSEVYWKMQDAVPLPDSVRERLKGKVIAITGYEADQVKLNGESVPITYAYNHHYSAWLLNSDKVELVNRGTSERATRRMGLDHGSEQHWVSQLLREDDDDSNSEIPLTQLFSEGNGGESRMSFHGYPKGYGQLIESPTTVKFIPMQIDTWNREMTTTKFIPGPLPKNSRIPSSAGYSGLIECPCSDRLEKKWAMTYTLQSSGDCTGSIQNSSECFSSASRLIEASAFKNNTVSDSLKPPGCSVELHLDGEMDIWWNTGGELSSEKAPRQELRTSSFSAFSRSQINVTVTMNELDSDDAVTIAIAGPSDRWFGVGFGSASMCNHMQADQCPDGGPWAIVVSDDENGGITERKLDYHGPGTVLDSSVTVQSDTSTNTTRTVVLTRPLVGAGQNYYTFDPRVSVVPIITATGCSLTFAQHCGHGPSSLSFLATDTPTPICRAGIEGTIGDDKFNSNKCAPLPYGDLLVQHNPTCSIETYRGGLNCCQHGKSLLDKEQDIPWLDNYLEYRLKFRFYFEEYKAAGVDGSSLPSHQNLVRLFWLTEAFSGEYDIVQCPEGTPPEQCVQVITARWQVRNMMVDCSLRPDASYCTGKGSTDDKVTEGIKLIYAGPHCHAPTCLSMDLFNADTGRLLCHMEPIWGASDELYDEKGFLALPPCLWGDISEGLVEPELLTLDTTLLSIKRNNSTLGHTGEMAPWQMRAVVVPRKQKHEKATLSSDSDAFIDVNRMEKRLDRRGQLRNAAN